MAPVPGAKRRTPSLPDEVSSQQRARLSRAVATTELLRVRASTAAGYNLKCQQFYKFCSIMRFASNFQFHQMSHFLQWYVSGFDETKHHAYTTCPQFISAWRDHCDYHGIIFPCKGSPTVRRLTKFIKALGVQFPHTPRQDLAITIGVLARVAAHHGIHSADCLWTIGTQLLCRWARCLYAHSLCLRGVEHRYGARCSDVKPEVGYYTCTVGVRDGESKYKGRPRLLPISVGERTQFDVGTVLGVFIRRVHGSSKPSAPLFPAFARGLTCTKGESGKSFYAWLAVALSATKVSGRIGESSFRAGGATDMFAQGATDRHVQVRGGWRGDTYKRYNRPTIDLQVRQQQALLQTRSTRYAAAISTNR
jgi:hypothetical protein